MSFVNGMYLALLVVGVVAAILLVMLVSLKRRFSRQSAELEAIGRTVAQQAADLHEVKGLSESLLTPLLDISTQAGVETYGYHKGAGDLTGDFYDYRQVSSEHVAVILGDVSGHGVEAAMISVLAVTVFDEWCARWQPGTSLLTLAERINDAVEFRRFHGRFVAFVACLFETRTGEAEIMNMGGEPIFVYRAVAKSVDTIKSTHLPCAGSLPWDLIQEHSSPEPHLLQLDVGDVLLFFSEGLEDSRRRRRTPPATGAGERDVSWEEFGYGRIYETLASVMNHTSMTIAPDDLAFDFSGCTGTAEEAVLAMAAAEKVFRLLPRQPANENGTIEVDPPVDRFLQGHLRQYGTYFWQAVAAEDGPLRYGGLGEDPQLDDLTVLALRRIAPSLKPQMQPRPRSRVIATPIEELPVSEVEDIDDLEELPGADDDEGELLPV